jgi:alkanesulfonate monooxygenase
VTLRFHWRLPPGGERPDVLLPAATHPERAGLPDLEARTEFCRLAQACGIDSILTVFGHYVSDPMLLATALALRTERVKFMVAYRPGFLSPTLFVQQVNTLSVLADGRVNLNIVVGHSQKEQGYYGDALDHDARYDRAGEFLAVCQALWRLGGDGDGVNFEGRYFKIKDARLGTPFVARDRTAPEIFLGGGSPLAEEVATKYASCWLLLGDHPEKLRARVGRAVAAGIEVGLRFSVIAAPTRRQALEMASSLVEGAETNWVEKAFVRGSDSVSMREAFAISKDADAAWLTPNLWSGAVPSHGASAIALVGSYEEVARALMDYKKLGVSHFILSGWPNADAVASFGEHILQLVRELESAEAHV